MSGPVCRVLVAPPVARNPAVTALPLPRRCSMPSTSLSNARKSMVAVVDIGR
jgi:hypothetical protein